ncbi:MAG: hypothetical protein KAR33_03035 [Candidatus Thorarchaeota archaeon]|nr:hypothetical protein [Candidatus Thorarchaeota archaeon]
MLEVIPEENSESRKLLKIFGVLLTVLLLLTLTQLPSIMIALNPELDPTYEPSHTITVWIEPKNYTFHLHMNFYLAENEVGDRESRQMGKTIRVDSFDDPENVGVLYAIQEGTSVLWIEFYVDEDVRVTADVMIGIQKSINLLGFPIEILIVPWHGEQ